MTALRGKMRVGGLLGVGVLLGINPLMTCPAGAAPLLQVQFRDSSTGSDALVPSFSDFPVPQTPTSGSAPLTRTYNAGAQSITLAQGITVDGNGDLNTTNSSVSVGSRDRATPAGSISYASLYQDFAFGQSSDKNGGLLGVEIKGLTPDASYGVTFYTYDNSVSRTEVISDITSGATGTGADAAQTVAYSAGHTFASNSDYAVTLSGTADASGRLLFELNNTVAPNGSGAATLNGLVVTATPEPATAGLLAFGALTLARRRRRA